MSENAAYRAGEFGGDLLWLHADVELRQLNEVVVGLEDPGQEPDESGFACPVLSQHDQNLRVCEVALLDLQPEVALDIGTPHIRCPGGWSCNGALS